MFKSLGPNLIIVGMVGLVLVASLNISQNKKVEAQANITKVLGYAWSENMGWISFSSDNVQATEAPQVAVPSVTPCSPLSPLTQTLACPSSQAGSITQTRTSVCPGPVTSDWVTTSNTCQSWRLPTIDELMSALEKQHEEIGFANNEFHWSSTKFDWPANYSDSPYYGMDYAWTGRFYKSWFWDFGNRRYYFDKEQYNKYEQKVFRCVFDMPDGSLVWSDEQSGTDWFNANKVCAGLPPYSYIPPTYKVILNSATGKTCAQICNENSLNCTSIGTNAKATDSTYWDDTYSYWNTSKYECSYVYVNPSFACGDSFFAMSGTGPLTCGDDNTGSHKARWTNCRCE